MPGMETPWRARLLRAPDKRGGQEARDETGQAAGLGWKA